MPGLENAAHRGSATARLAAASATRSSAATEMRFIVTFRQGRGNVMPFPAIRTCCCIPAASSSPTRGVTCAPFRSGLALTTFNTRCGIPSLLISRGMPGHGTAVLPVQKQRYSGPMCRTYLREISISHRSKRFLAGRGLTVVPAALSDHHFIRHRVDVQRIQN